MVARINQVILAESPSILITSQSNFQLIILASYVNLDEANRKILPTYCNNMQKPILKYIVLVLRRHFDACRAGNKNFRLVRVVLGGS